MRVDHPAGREAAVLAALVGLTVFGSIAYHWHSRDWNVSSRLMLTYAIGDRGQVAIDGLEDHTRDRARVAGRYYSDKSPGQSLAGLPVYAVIRSIGLVPAHPVGVKGDGFTHWWADYWVTLFTSGLATAIGAAVLTAGSWRLGVSAGGSALIGLSYGLATPAYVYGSLFYGHQLAAVLLLVALALIESRAGKPGRGIAAWLATGFFAGYAVLTELSLAPAAIILAGRLAWLVLRGGLRRQAIGLFLIGATVPALILMSYNTLAFGSPLTLGYFHEDLKEFSDVHSESNPLGLRRLDFSKIVPLLVGPSRGLLLFAPIVLLAAPGWVRLGRGAGGRPGLALTSLAIFLSVFAVNLSYPEWTGGWATGPRLLVASLPFALIGAAGFLIEPVPRWRKLLAGLLALAGAILMLLYQGAGGRVPHTISRPLVEFVWPIWQGRGPLECTIVWKLAPAWVQSLPAMRQWLQYLPLLAYQLVMGLLIGGFIVRARTRQAAAGLANERRS